MFTHQDEQMSGGSICFLDSLTVSLGGEIAGEKSKITCR